MSNQYDDDDLEIPDDASTPKVLLKLLSLLQKDIIDTATPDANTVELQYDDGERVRVTLVQLDRPRSDILN